MSYNIPNPCLLAVILTISTHNGPLVVFSYPPSLSAAGQHTRSTLANLNDKELLSDSESGTDWDASSEEDKYSDSDSDISETEDGNASDDDAFDALGNYRRPLSPGPSKRLVEEKHETNSLISQESGGDLNDGGGTQEKTKRLYKRADDDVLGFDMETLSEILCPPRTMCNKMFSLGVDDMIFVGLPIHIQQDGYWKKLRKKRQDEATSNTAANATANNTADTTTAAGASAANATDNEYSDPHSSMRMFHVSFVMNPPVTEYRFRVDQMYHHIVSKLVVALRSEQAKDNYVWEQAKLLLELRDKYSIKRDSISDNADGSNSSTGTDNSFDENGGGENDWGNGELPRLTNKGGVTKGFYAEALKKSSLALSLSQIYDAVKSSVPCSIMLNDRVPLLLQIPFERTFRRLPAITEPFLEGSCLIEDFRGVTNYDDSPLNLAYNEDVFTTENDNEKGTGDVNKRGPRRMPWSLAATQCAILLLDDDPEQIIRNTKLDPYGTEAEVIRTATPMESIQEISDRLEIHLNKMSRIVSELLQTDKARIISPVHYKHIYVVSPLAPISRLQSHYAPKFREMFPTMPNLPRFLSILSTGKPRTYLSHIPSKDHRELYLWALSWLLRYGFVFQLRTYILISVPRRIKQAVAFEQQRRGTSGISSEEPSGRQAVTSTNVDAGGATATSAYDFSTDNKRQPAQYSPSNGKGIPITGSNNGDNNTGSGSLPGLYSAPNSVPWSTGSASSAGADSLMDNEALDDSILLDPARATLVEKKWLAKITAGKPPPAVALFDRLYKYFDGRHSVERIMALEALGRQDLRLISSAFEEHLIIVKHW